MSLRERVRYFGDKGVAAAEHGNAWIGHTGLAKGAEGPDDRGMDGLLEGVRPIGHVFDVGGYRQWSPISQYSVGEL